MKAILLFISLHVLTTGFAQTELSGIITDESGQPIPFANVSLEGTYDGTTTDITGAFAFSTAYDGSAYLLVSFIGFKTFRKAIALTGTPQVFSITLKEDSHSLETVTISAGSFTAGDNSRRTVFRAVDIATTAGATADIAGALNTLPGTQKVGESGRLFVRGGEGNEAKTFIDGMLVLDAYSPSAPNAPSRGRFLPFMFKGISFSTGGYSAEYGQALSSALVLDSKDKAEVTRTDFGLLSVGADIGHTQSWERGSVGGKIQYTNIRPYFGLINQEIDWIIPPASIEGSAAFRQQSGKNGMVKVFGNFNQSSFSLYHHSIDNHSSKEPYELANQYGYLNGFYKNVLTENWIVRGGMSYTNIQNSIGSSSGKREVSEVGIHGKTVFEGSLSNHVEIKTGMEIFDRTYTQDNNTSQQSSFHEMITAGFAEADVFASKNFVSRGGLRVEYNQLNRSVGLDPRFSLAYKTGATGQVSLAYGKFRQSPKNEWLRIQSDLKSEKSDHYILNYQRVENNRTFRIETYYKRYSNLVKFLALDGARLDNSGYGFANGLELFWRDDQSIKNADYWISYSFLNTRRNYLNFPNEAIPAFASMHNFSAVYKHFIQDLKSQFGFTYAFASGRHYNNPNESSFNNSLTPDYHDVSFNWSYLPGPSVIIYFSCTNLLGRDNIFGYEFSPFLNEEGRFNARAIRQPAKNFVFMGIFITLSREKSVNQLPNL